MTLCKILVALAVFSGSVFAQSNADHSGFNDLQVNWKTDCAPRGCLMLTQVLRGDAGGPADPKDAREYVGLNVALARKTRPGAPLLAQPKVGVLTLRNLNSQAG
jgi:hypothetical protein